MEEYSLTSRIIRWISITILIGSFIWLFIDLSAEGSYISGSEVSIAFSNLSIRLVVGFLFMGFAKVLEFLEDINYHIVELNETIEEIESKKEKEKEIEEKFKKLKD